MPTSKRRGNGGKKNNKQAKAVVIDQKAHLRVFGPKRRTYGVQTLDIARGDTPEIIPFLHGVQVKSLNTWQREAKIWRLYMDRQRYEAFTAKVMIATLHHRFIHTKAHPLPTATLVLTQDVQRAFFRFGPPDKSQDYYYRNVLHELHDELVNYEKDKDDYAMRNKMKKDDCGVKKEKNKETDQSLQALSPPLFDLGLTPEANSLPPPVGVDESMFPPEVSIAENNFSHPWHTPKDEDDVIMNTTTGVYKPWIS